MGSAMRARGLAAQRVEARIGCKILNTMTALGMPDSEMIGVGAKRAIGLYRSCAPRHRLGRLSLPASPASFVASRRQRLQIEPLPYDERDAVGTMPT